MLKSMKVVLAFWFAPLHICEALCEEIKLFGRHVTHIASLSVIFSLLLFRSV